jgi:hypothetical protein
MLGAERHSQPGVPAGVLILRVWLEGGRGDRQLRIRMVGRHDLVRTEQEIETASTIEDTLKYVGDWLQRFAMSSR